MIEGKSMTRARTPHIIVRYRGNSRIYAVSEGVQRKLDRKRDRVGRHKEKLVGEELQKWLEDEGCRLDSSRSPAVIERKADGSTTYEAYWRNGKLDRRDGPAIVAHNADGSVREEYWRNNKLDREDGPAVVQRNANGATSEEYHRNGKRHREDGPAYVWRYADGRTEERYYRNGKLHRENGPAVVMHNADGSIYEENYIDDRLVKEQRRAPRQRLKAANRRSPRPPVRKLGYFPG
jgi:uncharacterized protein